MVNQNPCGLLMKWSPVFVDTDRELLTRRYQQHVDMSEAGTAAASNMGGSCLQQSRRTRFVMATEWFTPRDCRQIA
jgi:hypothetical protein